MPETMNADARSSYDREISQLKSEIQDLRTDVKSLVEAWNTAKGMTSFVKWLSGVITAAGVIYAFLNGHK